MKRLSTILRMAVADFRDRSRNYVYLVTIAATLYLGFLIIPPVGTSFYFTLTLGDYRGFYNAAWVGTAIAITGVTLFMMVGFYLMRNTVSRDAQYRVGELLATTRMSNTGYIYSKFVSNIFYLGSLLGVLFVMSFIMLILRGEDANPNFAELAEPLLLITLPAVVFISAMAVFFEVTPGLRGGFGNVLYFIAIMPSLIILIENHTQMDLVCIEIVETQMKEAIRLAVPAYTGGFSIGHMGMPMPAGSFYWEGLIWTSSLILKRASWLAIAIGFVTAGIPLFSRFDPDKQGRLLKQLHLTGTLDVSSHFRLMLKAVLSPLAVATSASRFGRMFMAEIRVALIGMPAIWYLVAIGLWIATLAAPVAASREYIMPLCWIWPILIWSQLGVREQRQHVDQILFSTPNAILRQPLAAWFAGFFVALLTASGFLIRALAAGEVEVAMAVVIGGMFVSSLALASGVITKSSRFFEVVYLLMWYIGPMNRAYELDFMGTFQQSIDSGMPWVYLMLAALLLPAALLVRSRQIRA